MHHFMYILWLSKPRTQGLNTHNVLSGFFKRGGGMGLGATTAGGTGGELTG